MAEPLDPSAVLSRARALPSGARVLDALAGARGVQLAEAGLRSSREGRKIELDALSLD